MLGANPLPGSEEDQNKTTTVAAPTPGSNSSQEAGVVLVEAANSTGGHDQEEAFVCAFYNPDFIIWSSLGSFYIPCFVMIFLYMKIFSVRMKFFACVTTILSSI